MSKRRLWIFVSAGLLGLVAAFGLVRMFVFPAKPPGPLVKLIGTYDTPGAAMGVTIAGSTAYVADGDEGLQILDVSDPTSPTLLGHLKTLGFARDIVVSESVAYVTTSQGLQAVAVSNPREPESLGAYGNPGAVRSVSVVGSIACLLHREDLQLLDVSNPRVPILLGTYDIPNSVDSKDLAVEGAIAYLVLNGGGAGQLFLVDLSNPSKPRHLGGCQFPVPEARKYGPRNESSATSVEVSGGFAFVSGAVFEPSPPDDCIVGDEMYKQQFHVVDVSTPKKSSMRSSLEEGYAICASTGAVAYSIPDNLQLELQVLNITKPKSPRLLESVMLEWGSTAWEYRRRNLLSSSVSVSGATIYVALGESGLRILDVSDLLKWAGLEPAPTPP